MFSPQRACSFGGFDLTNRAAVSPDTDVDEEVGGGDEAVKSHLGKKVKSVRETMRKHLTKRNHTPVSEQVLLPLHSAEHHKAQLTVFSVSVEPRANVQLLASERQAEARRVRRESEEFAERTELHE